MSDNIDDVRELLDGRFEIRNTRTGRVMPPNNRLVQLQDGGILKEFYLSQDDYETLMGEQ